MAVVAGLLVLAVITAIGIGYNALVRLRVLADNAWADIDVQLKRRHDLIPNVVEIVRGYKDFERATLERVVEARSRAMAAQGPAARGDAEQGVTTALRGLFALAEAYPQLRAVEQFASLQTTLVQIEDAIQNARRYHNAVVRDFNTRVQQFPSNLVALIFGFKARDFFQLATPDEGAVPEVNIPEGASRRG
jgi:LemA protein